MSRSVRPGAPGLVPVAHVHGEIDLSNAHDMRDRALELVADADCGLVIDLTEVTYLDSAGVRALFDVARHLKLRGQSLAVSVPPQSPLWRLLKIVRFPEASHVCDSPGAGIELLAALPTDSGGTSLEP